MYRLERPEDGYELGLMDAFEEAVCLIEWPDKLGKLIPEDALFIEIAFDGEGRRVTLTGFKEIT
jgi:tRNA threonylcarbamoyladenosine biosynthesis protein TsaE